MNGAAFRLRGGRSTAILLPVVIGLALCEAAYSSTCAPKPYLPADGETVMPGWTYFVCSAVPDASRYEIDFFGSPPATSSVPCEGDSGGTVWGRLSLEAPPDYCGIISYWAVRAHYPDGTVGPWSEAHRFTYNPPRMLFPNQWIPGIGGGQDSRRYYELPVPEGRTKLSLTVSASNGCNVFVKKNALPSPDNYDQVLPTSGTPRRLIVDNPAAGTWYVLLYGSAPYNDAVLTMSLEPAGLPQADIFADFRVPEILTNGVNIDLGPEVYYNPIDVFNPPRATTDQYSYILHQNGTSFVKGTFWLDDKKPPTHMKLVLDHLSSSIWDPATNEEVGYSPIVVEVNGHQVADQWDTAKQNRLTHGIATDVFDIPADRLHRGANSITVRLGDKATSNYWIQGLRIYADTSGRIEFGSDSYVIEETSGQALVRLLRLDATPTPAGDPNMSRPDILIRYTIRPLTATPGMDYTDVSDTLVFKAGELSKSIVIPILDDTQSEGSEQFAVSIDEVKGGAYAGTVSTATVTIVDDESSTPTVYVNASANPGGDGTRWETAYADLQQGLAAARGLRRDYVEVWVAEGTYRTATGASNGKTTSFDLANGVAIFGGFLGQETARNQRDPLKYPTILSGDTKGDDQPAFRNIEDNSLHVVAGEGVNATAILDGFTIRGGCTDQGYLGSSTRGGGMLLEHASPTIRRCIFTTNKASEGAGAFCGYGSHPVFESCRFLGNWVELDTFGGGGLSNWMSSPLLVNCVFTGNRAPRGGAISNWDGSPVFVNCTVQHNFASRRAGGMYAFESMYETVPVLRNTVVAHNVAEEGPELALQGEAEIVVEHSCVEQMDDGVWRNLQQASAMRWGGGVVDIDPLTTPDGHLKANSPLISAGVRLPESRIDIDGELRPKDSEPAIGADEYVDYDADKLPDYWERLYFGSATIGDPSADTDGDGLNNRDEYELFSSHPHQQPIRIDNSTRTIQDAVLAALPGDTIRLEPGTYSGSGNAQVDLLGKSVVIFGPGANCLSNSYAFGFWSGETPATALVGLTITGGSDPNGVVRCQSASPQLRECTISGSGSGSHQVLRDGQGFDFTTGTVVQANRGQVYFRQGVLLASHRPMQWGIIEIKSLWDLWGTKPEQYSLSMRVAPDQLYAILLTEDAGDLALIRPVSLNSSEIVFEWAVASGSAYPCSGIVGHSSKPLLANCRWNECFPLALSLSSGGALADGLLELGSQGWHAENALLCGDGLLRMQIGSTANLKDCFVRCTVQGPGTVLCPETSELVLEKLAELDLGDVDHPGERHILRCDGLLHTRDFASIRNARILVNWTRLTGHSVMVNSVFEPEVTHRWGEFYVEGDVKVKGNDIYADGDRYLDLDPDKLGPNAEITDCNICVRVSEGIGANRGGLLELRGRNEFCTAGSQCPSGAIWTGTLGAKEHVPAFSLTSWTLDRLELLPGAKLNLTNRFDYDNGDPYEVLYVKDLVLGEGSVLNTAFNTLYYDRISGEGIFEDIPLLGYSLENIDFEDVNEFAIRVQHNNSDGYAHVTCEPDDYDGHIMHMQTLEDDAGIFRAALAKGQFDKAGHGRILVKCEYLFTSQTGTLDVYLSDARDIFGRGTPDHDKHYRLVGRVQPPSPGRPGSAGSGRFGTFEEVINAGDLDFRRGTYIELELMAGQTQTEVLIDNLDPWEHVNGLACGDVANTNGKFEAIDFAFIMSECGTAAGMDVSATALTGETCGFLFEDCTVRDGYITIHDALAALALYFRGSASSCNNCISVQQQTGGTLSLSPSPSQWPRSCYWLVGQSDSDTPNAPYGVSFFTEHVYFVDEDGTEVNEPVRLPLGSVTGQIHVAGNALYTADLGMGLVRYSDAGTGEILITPPPRNDPDGGFAGILDASYAGNSVYVTPVFSDSDKRQLPRHYFGQTNGYSYDYSEPIVLGSNGDIPREMEVDDAGNAYVLVPRYKRGSSYDDRLFVLPHGQKSAHTYTLTDVGIRAPTAMQVSGSQLFVSSSLNSPEANETSVHCLPVDGLLGGALTKNNVSSILIKGMGHATAIAVGADGHLMVVGFTMQQIPTLEEMKRKGWALEKAFYHPFYAKIPIPFEGGTVTANALGCDGLGLPLAIVWVGDNE